MIRPRFLALGSDDIDQKAPGDYVTVADREAEQLLSAELLARNPGCLIVGEEASFTDPKLRAGLDAAELAYTIDPVDGTANFVNGSKRYAVMIAETRRGEVTRAWIWQPETGRAYVAERGGGVRCNDRVLTRRPGHHPPIGGGARSSVREYDLGADFAEIVPSNNCAGFDYPQLLAGEVDFFVYRKPMPWDHLPGMLMLNELDGVVLAADGQAYGPANATVPAIVAAGSVELAGQVAARWQRDPAAPTR